ncbi:MAG TPA: HesA/MoeB/ThiF family protein [Spirochaetota bacterium]|nr:HesA/MoeB/ThiF family protein [Spirochaetota bacterium]HPI89974.1 HesA/MoeB/ThiF family protein [Spirochaetota bacterium]HPR48409.1 HesA/MoeB/ThiF family protein [Spirochaetota bacterium]
MTLSNNEKIRYQRQTAIQGWDESVQLKLKHSRVFIAGAGGLGSPVLYYLAAAGIGTIALCDHDRVDLSNLNRQILHTSDDVGKLKVVSARESIQALNPDITLELMPERVESEKIIEVVKDVDLVVDCLDSFSSRLYLNSLCIELNKPMIHAGISEYHGQVTFIHVPETPCLECFIPSSRDTGPVPVLGATAGIVGSIQALEAVKYLAGSKDLLKNVILFIDGQSMSFTRIAVSRNPGCPRCGSRGQ